MALSKIDVANMLTGATPITNGGTGLTSNALRPLSKPIIINGDMAVAQRSTSVTSVSNGDGGYQTCDRMRFDESGTMGAALTITQESLTSGNAFLNGFANAFKVDVTTADSSPDADDWSRLNMRIEAQDMKPFKKGTSSAEKYTLAFWVKATKTGTNTIELFDADNTRSIGGSYTISSSDTWEHKVVNFAADTTGAFADDNGEGLRISWSLSAGSNYTSGTLPSAWESSTVANTAPNQVNHFDSTSNNFHITGIQLEVGEFSSTTLPPFQFENFGDNYRRCLRYCYQITSDSSVDTDIVAMTGTGSAGFGAFRYPVQMRGNPAVSVTADGDFSLFGDTSSALSSLRGDRINTNSCGLVTDTSVSSGDSASLRLDSDSGNKYLRLDAELE